MKTPTSIFVGCAMILLLSSGCNSPRSALAKLHYQHQRDASRDGPVLWKLAEVKPPKLEAGQLSPPIVILTQPSSKVAEIDTFVDFTVIATNAQTYQWKKSNASVPGTYTNIPNAMSSTYSITNVAFADVASYVVELSSETSGSLVSEPAHLSVYLRYSTNSTFGTLETPIGAFSSGESASCGGTFYPQGYSPHDGSGIYYLFYGPAVPGGGIGPFANSEYKRNLSINSNLSVNSPADTAVRLRKNWFPGTEIYCNTTPAPGAAGGPTDLQTTGADKTYKLTIFYNTTPTSGKIGFNWLYH